MNSIQAITHELVDYAGLFPPAKLELEPVVENYESYRNGPNRDMLARLIVPAARLGEFEKVAADVLPTSNSESPWRISGLVPPLGKDDSDFRFAISGIQQFNQRHQAAENGLAVVDAIEIKAPTPELVHETIEQIPDEVNAFLEIPHQTDPAESIKIIADSGKANTFAKIRTGGVTPELIPPPSEVARFIFQCAEQLVGLKATAGLHHPLRDKFRLTYEPDSDSATMHGFVNVFTAICFAFGCSISVEEIEAILACDDREAFGFQSSLIRWKDWTLSATKVARLRQRFAVSFGSCSFTEPTGELEQLGFSRKEGGSLLGRMTSGC